MTAGAGTGLSSSPLPLALRGQRILLEPATHAAERRGGEGDLVWGSPWPLLGWGGHPFSGLSQPCRLASITAWSTRMSNYFVVIPHQTECLVTQTRFYPLLHSQHPSHQMVCWGCLGHTLHNPTGTTPHSGSSTRCPRSTQQVLCTHLMGDGQLSK